MLIADATRRRCTWWPLMFLLFGLGLALGTAGIASSAGIREALLPGALALVGLGWFALGWRHARREGDQIVVRSVLRVRTVPAEGSDVGMVQGGGSRSPHLDVLLQPAEGEPVRLARLEMLGVSRAPRMARRIAEVLDVPTHEPSLRPFEALLSEAAEQRRAGWRWLAGIVVIGTIASVVMMIVSGQTMATLVIRCPGGETRAGGMTMIGDLEMTYDAGVHAFELHPPDGPAWSQRVELVAGQTTVLDCRARHEPSNDMQRRSAPSY